MGKSLKHKGHKEKAFSLDQLPDFEQIKQMQQAREEEDSDALMLLPYDAGEPPAHPEPIQDTSSVAEETAPPVDEPPTVIAPTKPPTVTTPAKPPPARPDPHYRKGYSVVLGFVIFGKHGLVLRPDQAIPFSDSWAFPGREYGLRYQRVTCEVDYFGNPIVETGAPSSSAVHGGIHVTSADLPCGFSGMSFRKFDLTLGKALSMRDQFSLPRLDGNWAFGPDIESDTGEEIQPRFWVREDDVRESGLETTGEPVKKYDLAYKRMVSLIEIRDWHFLAPVSKMEQPFLDWAPARYGDRFFGCPVWISGTGIKVTDLDAAKGDVKNLFNWDDLGVSNAHSKLKVIATTTDRLNDLINRPKTDCLRNLFGDVACGRVVPSR